VRAHKLGVFTIGGAVAGLAGAFYAAWGPFIDPSVFALQQAAFVAIWVLLGGRSSLLGAFVGVAFVQEISAELGSTGSTATPIVLGAILIAVVLVLPRGVVPSALALARRASGRGPASAPDAASASAAPQGPVTLLPAGAAGSGLQLGVRGIRKEFDGVAAVDGVDLTFPARGVECLIGPNGAGKSTLFGLLVGRHRPTAGEVTLGGEAIERRHPHERARRGIGIKLQIASLFGELSARENVWLAAFARHRDAARADERADTVLSALDLAHRASEPAAVLSHGEQQWLEIGMVVAGDPQVILLDEPTAGMSRQETARTVEVVRALGEQAAVVVVEHDMEFVRMLDVPVTVLHEGKVFARGSLAELREDGRVLDVYLGRAHAEAR
jgi:branched-chain amino acid transport system permease protein